MRRSWFLVAAIVAAMTAALPLRGDDDVYHKIYYVRVGDTAPEIQCRDDAGKLWRSKDLVGKKAVILVFYLGDFFPDCTKRLTTYRDYQPTLASLGAEVIAISGDVPENHELFKKANKLNFPLMADLEGKAAQQFGVYASSGGFTITKDTDGKELRFKRAVTLSNWTFIVSKEGKVVYKDMKPDPTGDSKKVYELLYRLAAAKR